jgi:hypothetical protein
MRRSEAHNRRVGGVPSSHHLSGRAIDIARYPGVTHSQIAAAYRLAGYSLIESLDEGDHSHFAFGTAAVPVKVQVTTATQQGTKWGLVRAPSSADKPAPYRLNERNSTD